MVGKMFDESKCAICDQSSLDKSILKRQGDWTSKEIVRELELAVEDGKLRGILVYEVFKNGNKRKKRGRLYILDGSETNVEQFLVNLFDISLSHRIVGIGWKKILIGNTGILRGIQ